MKIEFARSAERDLRELRAYFARNDEAAARRVAERLEKSIGLLAGNPEVGRPGLVPGTREWSVPGLPYLIPYRTVGDVLFVLRVWHTARQRPSEW